MVGGGGVGGQVDGHGAELYEGTQSNNGRDMGGGAYQTLVWGFFNDDTMTNTFVFHSMHPFGNIYKDRT